MNKKNLLVKHKGQLIPFTDEDKIVFDKIEDGEKVVFSTSDARELWRHRRFFLLLNMVKEHLPEYLDEKYPTTEKLLTELKLQMGMYETHISLGGKTTIVLGSISFASMGEEKFKEFCVEASRIILKYFLKDIDFETFKQEFLDVLFV